MNVVLRNYIYGVGVLEVNVKAVIQIVTVESNYNLVWKEENTPKADKGIRVFVEMKSCQTDYVHWRS